jgi:hypothetical protein
MKTSIAKQVGMLHDGTGVVEEEGFTIPDVVVPDTDAVGDSEGVVIVGLNVAEGKLVTIALLTDVDAEF